MKLIQYVKERQTAIWPLQARGADYRYVDGGWQSTVPPRRWGRREVAGGGVYGADISAYAAKLIWN